MSYPPNFPCADYSWTYIARSGKCYKLMSEVRRFNLEKAQIKCLAALEEYPRVQVRIAEVRDVNDVAALKEVLIRHAMKEKVLLNAKRQGTCFDISVI